MCRYLFTEFHRRCQKLELLKKFHFEQSSRFLSPDCVYITAECLFSKLCRRSLFKTPTLSTAPKLCANMLAALVNKASADKRGFVQRLQVLHIHELLMPRCVSATLRSLTQTSISAELPSGRYPSHRLKHIRTFITDSYKSFHILSLHCKLGPQCRIIAICTLYKCTFAILGGSENTFLFLL